MNLELICQRWLEAAFNGVLQGTLLTVFVAVILRWSPRTNAATRHAIWFLTLLCVTSLPLFQGVGSIRGWSGAIGVPFAIRSPGDMPNDSHTTDVDPSNQNVDPSGPVGMNLPEDVVSTRSDVPKEWSLPNSDVEALDSAGKPVLHARRPWAIRLPRKVPVAVVVAWILMGIFRVVRLIRAFGWVRRLKEGSVSAGVEGQRLFEMLKESMGVGRRICLRVGPEDCTPLVAGFFEPAVIVPAGFLGAGSWESVAQVLRHELGHVRRLDDWSNLVQQMIAAVCFFHPAVHWISRRLALDREIACDDHVLDANAGGRSYALLLTHFAGRKPGREWIAAPAVWSRSNELKERIAMILNPKRNSSPRIAGVTVGILLAVTAGFAGALLQAGPRVEVFGSEVSPGGVDGAEPRPTATDVTDPTPVSGPQATSVELQSSASPDAFPPSADPLPSSESGLAPEPVPRKGRTLKNGKPLSRVSEKYRDEMIAADLVEARLARLERTLEEMKSSLKNRGTDVQRGTRSPDENQNIVRKEARNIQDGARREAERELELVWKLQGDLIQGRAGAAKGDPLAKTGTLDAERLKLEAMRQALERELKKIDERIVRLNERQKGSTAESDTKTPTAGGPDSLKSDTQERDSRGPSTGGR